MITKRIPSTPKTLSKFALATLLACAAAAGCGDASERSDVDSGPGTTDTRPPADTAKDSPQQMDTTKPADVAGTTPDAGVDAPVGSGSPDTGSADVAGKLDTGPVDAGADTAAADAGAPDAAFDAASPDAAEPDASQDTAAQDAALQDAGDAGSQDAGDVASTAVLIDDFEDCNAGLAASSGLATGWFVYVDGIGSTLMPSTFAPATGGKDGSTMCSATMKGTTVLDVGMSKYGYAGMGFGLGTPFDASIYGGISLWVKGSGSARLSIHTKSTTPVSDGGTCASDCEHFGRTVTATAAWTKVSVLWTEFTHTGAGTIDPTTFTGLQLDIGSGEMNFDLAYDDFEFLPR